VARELSSVRLWVLERVQEWQLQLVRKRL